MSKYDFHNNKGEVIKFDGSMTIAELAAIGVTNITLSPPEPLLDGWYMHDPNSTKRELKPIKK